MDEWIAGAHSEGTYKNKSYDSPNPRLCRVSLSLHSSEAVAVRFVAVGLSVVERLHLLLGGTLVSGLLFPDQVSAVVEQVARQQEASQREDQQAKVDLKGSWTTEVESYSYSHALTGGCQSLSMKIYSKFD